jgi:hypothetical protein
MVEGLNWKVAAFISLFCYSVNNYLSGTQKGDVYAGKMANSMSLGVFALISILYKLR